MASNMMHDKPELKQKWGNSSVHVMASVRAAVSTSAFMAMTVPNVVRSIGAVKQFRFPTLAELLFLHGCTQVAGSVFHSREQVTCMAVETISFSPGRMNRRGLVTNH